MAALGDTALVTYHGTTPPGWDPGQVEHPAIVTGIYEDANLIDAQVFRRGYGPAQLAGVVHQDDDRAVNLAKTSGQYQTWRAKP